MPTKIITIFAIAALLLTGTPISVSNITGQGVQLQQPPEAIAPADPYLTADQALEIALNHAGLTADQIRRPDREFDWDRGIPEWEVEFSRNGWEYSYEIHAETGVILEQGRERD